jgi:hypothetical protein
MTGHSKYIHMYLVLNNIDKKEDKAISLSSMLLNNYTMSYHQLRKQ